MLNLKKTKPMLFSYLITMLTRREAFATSETASITFRSINGNVLKVKSDKKKSRDAIRFQSEHPDILHAGPTLNTGLFFKESFSVFTNISLNSKKIKS